MLRKKTSSLGKKDYLDIYISLNTENMSQVSIYLQQYGDKIDLNFKLNEEHIDYFKSKESDLVRLLKAYPFKIGKIGYLEEAPKKVIGLDKKVKTRYFLDVEV